MTVVYKGSDDLGDKSKYGQGTYDYIGFQKEDKSAIYAQSQADYDKKHIEDGHRSVILIDWQNSHNWIGTVLFALPQFVLIVCSYITSIPPYNI